MKKKKGKNITQKMRKRKIDELRQQRKEKKRKKKE